MSGTATHEEGIDKRRRDAIQQRLTCTSKSNTNSPTSSIQLILARKGIKLKKGYLMTTHVPVFHDWACGSQQTSAFSQECTAAVS